MPVRIALDAMGGDLAPAAPVGAARTALLRRAGALEVILVGPAPVVEEALDAAGGPVPGLTVFPSGPGVPEGGHPATWMRAHPDSSVQTAARLAATGEAEAAVSMGHTGACLVAAVWEMGLLPGVVRPAAAVTFAFAPDMVFLDAGPNPDPGPEEIVQFARLGAAYARVQFGVREPTVALLSNGAESGKGNRLARAAHDLLRQSGLRFVGNCEGNDLVRRPADVVVTDGFTGNCVLKAIEGLGEHVVGQLRALLPPSLPGREEVLSGVAALGDATQTGAPVAFLGVDGVFVPGHGRSGADAIAATLLRTEGAVRAGLAPALRRALEPEGKKGATLA